EALARSRHSVFLAFLRARVAREETLVFQALAEFRIVLDERTRDAEPHRARLARHAAPGDRCENIELVGCFGQKKRPPNLGSQRLSGEEGVEGPVVDADGAAARSEKNASGGCLAPSGAVILRCCHVTRPRSSMVSEPCAGGRHPRTLSISGTLSRR